MAFFLSDKICGLLIERKALSRDSLEKAKKIYTESGGELSDILIRMKALTWDDLLAALSGITGIAPLKLSRFTASGDLLKLVPKRIAFMYQVIPISRMGNFLTIAMVDPMNIFALDDLRSLTKLVIRPILSDGGDMKEALEKYYERSIDEEITDIVGEVNPPEIEMIESGTSAGAPSGEILTIADDAPVIRLANLILSQAVKEKASDVLIEPMEQETRVRYRIDGVFYPRHTAPKNYHNTLISRLKIISDLNIAEHRLPQDGRFRLDVDGRRVDFRLSLIPSVLGEKASLRILDKGQVMIDISRLGLIERDQRKILSAAEKPHGMILVCGPTGAGKTTTLYSVLKYVDAPEKNLVTVEDPVEYQLKGINQVSIRSEIGLTFAASLRSILRQDPDVIMIGEIRDFETVDIAIKAALTGHLVLSTLHTNTASGSIVRLINMGVEPFLIVSSVIIFVGQRLVRTLCHECKEAYTPPAEVAEKYVLLDKNGDIPQIYRPRACAKCFNSGYRGRTAIVECIEVTPAIKDLIFRRAGEAEINMTAKKEGMLSLRENGIENVLSGVTSLEEVLRATAETGDAA